MLSGSERAMSDRGAPAAARTEVSATWDAMTGLRAPLPEVREELEGHGLADGLAIVAEALFADGAGGRRRVPSAGAIFPYAAFVLARYTGADGTARWGLFRADEVGRASCRERV